MQGGANKRARIDITPSVTAILDLAALRTVIQTGANKGATVLWQMAHDALVHRDYKIDEMITLYGTQLTLDDLRNSPESGYDKGKTLLWLLAYIAVQLHPFPLQYLFEQNRPLFEGITIQDLRAKPYGTDEVTALWLIIAGVPFYKVRYCYNLCLRMMKQFSDEDICHIPNLNGVGNIGRSVLQQILVSALQKKDLLGELFSVLWHQFHRQIPIKDYELIPTVGAFKEYSFFILILECSLKNIIPPDILHYLLGRTHLCCSAELLDRRFSPTGNTFRESLNQAGPLGLQTLLLLEKKQVFLNEVARIKKNPDEYNRVQLMDLTSEAQNAGYDANFDLANLMSDMGDEEDACTFYKNITKISPHYQTAVQLACEKYYALALTYPVFSAERLHYLEESLGQALKFRGVDMIQKIANTYINAEKKLGLELYIIPEHWVTLFTENTPVAHCFKIFDDLKNSLAQQVEITELKNKIQALERQNAANVAPLVFSQPLTVVTPGSAPAASVPVAPVTKMSPT